MGNKIATFFKSPMNISESQAGLRKTAWGAHKVTSRHPRAEQIIYKFQLQQAYIT